MRVVAVLNQKGGVGKTTTAVNLGAALALREERVLLVDLDPQGNLTDHLGIEPGPEQPTTYDVLTAESTVAAAVVPTSWPHLSVLPGHEDLAAVELELAGVAGREVRLRDALSKLPPQAYDWVLIDCPPSLGLLSLNALAAAPEVLLTLQTEYFALRGLGQLDRIVELVRSQINPALRIAGIVPTLVDPVTNLAREVIDEVKSVYGHRVLSTRIRKNVRLAEAPGHRQHIFAYAPGSPGAADYHALADEVLALEPAVAAGSPTAAKGEAAPKPPAKVRIPVAIPVEEPPKVGVVRAATGRFQSAAKPAPAVATPPPKPAPATNTAPKPASPAPAKASTPAGAPAPAKAPVPAPVATKPSAPAPAKPPVPAPAKPLAAAPPKPLALTSGTARPVSALPPRATTPPPTLTKPASPRPGAPEPLRPTPPAKPAPPSNGAAAPGAPSALRTPRP